MSLIKISAFVIVFIIGITFFTLYRNDANLFQAPGFSKRMMVFLTSNSAATANNHVFEELRTPVFNISADKLYQRVLNAATTSGWSIAAHDSDNQNANFIVHSPVFLLEDDVYVQVKFIDMNQSSLYIQSVSRLGRADFAANSGHIQALLKSLSAM